MNLEPGTILENLKKFTAFLKKKGSSVFDLHEVTDIGIDFETAKELVNIMEFAQKKIPRIRQASSEETEQFFVGTEYGVTRDSLLAELGRLRELMLARPVGYKSEAPAALPGELPAARPMTLMSEVKIAVKARRDKMLRDETEGGTILIEFPEKEFSAKFICGVCNHTIDFPYHCDSGPLQFNTEKRELYCDICGYRSTIPKHCGKYMSAEYYEGDKPLALVRIKDDELYRRSPDWYAHEDEKT